MNKKRNEYHRNYAKIYHRTLYGLVSKILSLQRVNSKRRNHPMPPWKTKELYDFCMSSSSFLNLYHHWVDSNYEKTLVPTIDRIDARLPYDWDNIQFLTAWDNMYLKKDNGHDKKRPVKQIDIKTLDIVNIFDSVKEAVRFLNRKGKGSIDRCARGEQEYSYGYKWEYV